MAYSGLKERRHKGKDPTRVATGGSRSAGGHLALVEPILALMQSCRAFWGFIFAWAKRQRSSLDASSMISWLNMSGWYPL